MPPDPFPSSTKRTACVCGGDLRPFPQAPFSLVGVVRDASSRCPLPISVKREMLQYLYSRSLMVHRSNRGGTFLTEEEVGSMSMAKKKLEYYSPIDIVQRPRERFPHAAGALKKPQQPLSTNDPQVISACMAMKGLRQFYLEGDSRSAAFISRDKPQKER